MKVRFNPIKHSPDKTEMGVSVNGWSFNFLVGMTDDQLRNIAVAIFRHLAKKKSSKVTSDIE